MFVVPKLVHLASGSSEGLTPLNAFDNALLDAGVHNLNLIRVSSIVPRDAVFGPLPELEVGTLTPCVYTFETSSVPGEVVSACVGAGVGEQGGVLMEYHHSGPGEAAERVVLTMIEEAFKQRAWALETVTFTTAEHKVDRLGCAVAAAVLWAGRSGEGDPRRAEPSGGTGRG
jgi:arginine decarboxylase